MKIKEVRDIYLLMLVCFGVLFILMGVLTIKFENKLVGQQTQITQQQEEIEILNSKLDTYWAETIIIAYNVDEELYRLKAQLTAYDNVLQDILEEQYNEDEYVYTKQEMINAVSYMVYVVEQGYWNDYDIVLDYDNGMVFAYQDGELVDQITIEDLIDDLIDYYRFN